jgi:hypothetical protein
LQVKTVKLRQALLPEAERSLAELARIIDVIRDLERPGNDIPDADSDAPTNG